MSKRKVTKREPESGGLADDSAYLAQWATNLRKAVTTDELRAMWKGYDAIARNRKLPDEDRRIARNRAKVLKRQL